MNAINKLLDKTKESCAAATDMALAVKLAVTRQAVSNWRVGRAYPDPVACARIAEITGEPLARVLGIVGEARALSTEEKKVWRRLATAAALVLAVGLTAAATPAQAAAQRVLAASNNAGLYIMRSFRAFLNGLRRLGQDTPLTRLPA
jgi:hypothetical protein